MKIFLDSIGCRLNQSEIERIARQFVLAGHSLVDGAEKADLVVINTCAVTAKAASDSRAKIRQAAHKNPQVKIISTGCWSTLEPERAEKMENIVQVVLNEQKEQLAQDFLNLPDNYFTDQPMDYFTSIPGSHADMRAFIKIQDGCDNFCTFCVTRIARGKSYSLAMERIIQEIRAVDQSGTREIVLSGVNLGSWGRDFSKQNSLANLIAHILAETDIARIRLSSLEPWDIGEEFFALWENPRLCRHFHLPLQSGSDVILKRMGRRITRKKFLSLTRTAKEYIKDLSLTTDIIVGFPGETEQDFQQSMDIVEEIGFSDGHVFSYSARPGTPAYTLDGAVDAALKKERSYLLRAQFQKSGQQYRQRQIGHILPVLWENSHFVKDGVWRMSGLSDSYLRTKMVDSKDRCGQIEPVYIKSVEKGILQGSKVE